MLPEVDGCPQNAASLECAYLMQVLLVLPSLLEQSGLSMRRIEDTLGVIRDLAQFVSAKNGELFTEPLRLDHEEYETGRDVARPFLLPRMAKLASNPEAENPKEPRADGQDSELIREIIQPEDMQELSGFIGTVLSQLLPCRATEYDALTRQRKGITVGYPGMMCRHCAGKGTTGKYFFTSLDSLNTCCTASLGHIYACPYVPKELKTRIADLKTRHPAERKALKHGAQAHFFQRLWKRLWSTDGIPDAPFVLGNHRNLGPAEQGEQLGEQLSSADSALEEERAHPIEFKSHTELLDYINMTPPWNGKADLRERIQQYYGCIAFGGKIYNTNAMPKNFSSEWILSKMVHPDRLSTKRTFLAG